MHRSNDDDDDEGKRGNESQLVMKKARCYRRKEGREEDEEMEEEGKKGTRMRRRNIWMGNVMHIHTRGRKQKSSEARNSNCASWHKGESRRCLFTTPAPT